MLTLNRQKRIRQLKSSTDGTGSSSTLTHGYPTARTCIKNASPASLLHKRSGIEIQGPDDIIGTSPYGFWMHEIMGSFALWEL